MDQLSKVNEMEEVVISTNSIFDTCPVQQTTAGGTVILHWDTAHILIAKVLAWRMQSSCFTVLRFDDWLN